MIISSSGGVDGESELVWAGYLAELGIATLALHSFTVPGVRRVSRDQIMVDGLVPAVDGVAGWR